LNESILLTFGFNSDSHYEGVSLLNFFLDRDIIPIEITFDRDQSFSDLKDIFESLKSKIGPPRNDELTRVENEGLQEFEVIVGKKEARALEDNSIGGSEKKQEAFKVRLILWGIVSCLTTFSLQTLEVFEKKRKDTELAKVPKIHKKNAIECLVNSILAHAGDRSIGDLELDEIVKEFRKILK
jgi:hypothetical protein